MSSLSQPLVGEVFDHTVGQLVFAKLELPDEGPDAGGAASLAQALRAGS